MNWTECGKPLKKRRGNYPRRTCERQLGHWGGHWFITPDSPPLNVGPIPSTLTQIQPRRWWKR